MPSTDAIATGVDGGGTLEPDNFAAVVGHAKVGRYPFGIPPPTTDARCW